MTPFGAAGSEFQSLQSLTIPTSTAQEPKGSDLDGATSSITLRPIIPGEQLNSKSVQLLDASIDRPNYLDLNIKVSHLHIGPGNFFKAEIAPSAHKCIQSRGPGWEKAGIAVVSVRGNGYLDTLQQQDGLYTLVERSGEGDPKLSVIGAIREWHNALKDPTAVIHRMADPDIKTVTMTITAPSYFLNEDGELDLNADEIARCRKTPGHPSSTYGFIVEALKLRMENGQEPFVVVSCDNLPKKGERTKAALIDYTRAQAREHQNKGYDKLAEWMTEKLLCPNTMVDRITPKTRPEDVALVEKITGLHDNAPVVTEAFNQIVVQSEIAGKPTFGSEIPGWLQSKGSILSPDVDQYAELKTWMVNGGHVILAWIGTRLGIPKETPYEVGELIPKGPTYVHELMRMPGVKDYLRYVMQSEIAPNVGNVPGVNISEYIEQVLKRFSNADLPDALWRLNNNAAEKILTRNLTVVAKTIERNERDGKAIPFNGLLVPLACWYTCRLGMDQDGARADFKEDANMLKLLEQATDLSKFLAIGQIWDKVPVYLPRIARLNQAPRFILELGKLVESMENRDILSILSDFKPKH